MTERIHSPFQPKQSPSWQPRRLDCHINATWFAVVLQCCFGLRGSSQSLLIVDQAFSLLWVMSVDSIRVCHALRRSSDMPLISSSPSVMVLPAKGSSSYFSRYSSISSMDSGVRPGT